MKTIMENIAGLLALLPAILLFVFVVWLLVTHPVAGIIVVLLLLGGNL